MEYAEHTISDDLVTWGHEDGVCKLVRVPREEIDEGSDEADAYDLLWIEASTNLRRFEIRLDGAYRRRISERDRERVLQYLATAPKEAVELLNYSSAWSLGPWA